MHEKYASKGLVVVSLSIDLLVMRVSEEDVKPEKAVAEVRKLLTKQKAGFGALVLDEPDALVQKKLHFVGAPCAFVFDRQGKWTQFSSDRGEFDANKIEKLVVELLNEK